MWAMAAGLAAAVAVLVLLLVQVAVAVRGVTLALVVLVVLDQVEQRVLAAVAVVVLVAKWYVVLPEAAAELAYLALVQTVLVAHLEQILQQTAALVMAVLVVLGAQLGVGHQLTMVMVVQVVRMVAVVVALP
jgi:hypothetical protein